MDNMVDVHTQSSDRKGLMGLAEKFFRRFRALAFTLALVPLLFVYVICIGISLTPAIALVAFTHSAMSQYGMIAYSLAIGLSSALGFFIFGITLILVVPAMNWMLRLKLKPWRGPAYSLEIIPWYYHNALVMLVKYAFLDYVTPSPLTVLFYKLMGMKIGKGTQIATTNITDPCLITLGDHVYVGGSAHIIAHYGMKGYFILSPVIVKNNVTIGLKASIFAGATIQPNTVIRAHSVVMPKDTNKDTETNDQGFVI